MDIVLLTSSYPLNPDDSEAAAGLFVRDFAAELARQGHTVRVLTQGRSGPTDDDPSFEVTRYGWRGQKPLSTLRVLNPDDLLSILSVIREGHRALARLIRTRPPDLILALWAVPAGLLARRAWRRWGIPYRVWALGSDIWGYGKNPWTRPLVRYALRGADRVFADGFKLAGATAALYGREVEFLPSSRRLPVDLPCPPPLHNDLIHFLFIGRYHPNKGPDLLLEAVALLDRDVRERCRFHMFGGGPMEAPLKTTIRDRGIDGQVVLHGYADRRTAASYLAHCRALIIPSRIESIPVVLSDAAQAGCPLITTDVGDMGVLVEKFGAGKVCRPYPSSIKDGILEMCQNDQDAYRQPLRELRDMFSLENSSRKALEGA